MMNEVIFTESSAIRLDRYLRRLYPYLTQGNIEQALRNKNILVNNQKSKSNLRLKNADKILISTFLIHDQKVPSSLIYSQGVIKLANKILTQYLIYDHPSFIAINKPGGVCAQGGSKINLSIDDALSYLNSIDNSINYKLVHRIDKDTSGIMLIAKSYDPASIITQGFKDRLIKKTYLAVVHDIPVKSEGEISNFIAKDSNNAYQKVVQDQEMGKLAITKYKLIEKLKSNLSLIEFTPITGRMHQIRVHALSLGCPILGDKKYGDNNTNTSNMFLHAYQIFIPSILLGKEILIKAELPKYFLKVLS